LTHRLEGAHVLIVVDGFTVTKIQTKTADSGAEKGIDPTNKPGKVD
jgi:hypothetical protein